MSVRETALAALHARLVAALAPKNPAPKVLRNETVPQRLPPGFTLFATGSPEAA